jgi:hypothetical protein
MMYPNSISRLQDVVQWLENRDEKTRNAWKLRTLDISDCISELDQIKLRKRPDKLDVLLSEYDSDASKSAAAIPILKTMLAHMTIRERFAALKSGKAALAVLLL